MIVHVDPATGETHLDEPEVFDRFHCRTSLSASAQAVADTLGAHGSAADDEHVYVRIDAVRAWAAPTDQAWNEAFEGMVGYARSKGWLDEAGEAIRAHIERV